MTEFEGVVATLGQALSKRGYTQLTPVQTAVLAPELIDSDILVSAQTGSGKTVAFGLFFARTLMGDGEKMFKAKSPEALIVAPTRELALQVMRELDWLYEYTGAVVMSCVGGMDARMERRNLVRGAHIVVGTPGRLRDHIERGALKTDGLKAVVLDEADEMLDLGFREDLEFILGKAPKERQTLMFSATVPRSITNIAKRYQRDAVRVTAVGEQSQHGDIEYRALTVANNDSEKAIINVLRYFEAKNALVFCATRAAVSRLTSRFHNRGFSVVALSGELSQQERNHALQAMRDGRARVCVATDVAARGLDLPNLELVIHADLPKNKESLLHRSGRTGRAGRKGVCTLIVPHNARRRTERLLKSANIEATWAKPPSAEDVIARDDERILADDVLSNAVAENEIEFARKLLAAHGPDQVAAAFVRLYRSRQSAPEELLDVPAAPERQQRSFDDFKNSVWISLSVGRSERAEPRWILPMLCGAGGINKRDIGAIRIQEKETFVELTAKSVDRFLESIGPDGKLEKNIVATKLDDVPAGATSKFDKSAKFSKPAYDKKKPFKSRKRSPQKESRTEDGDKPAFKPAFKAAPRPDPVSEGKKRKKDKKEKKRGFVALPSSGAKEGVKRGFVAMPGTSAEEGNPRPKKAKETEKPPKKKAKIKDKNKGKRRKPSNPGFDKDGSKKPKSDAGGAQTLKRKDAGSVDISK